MTTDKSIHSTMPKDQLKAVLSGREYKIAPKKVEEFKAVCHSLQGDTNVFELVDGVNYRIEGKCIILQSKMNYENRGYSVLHALE